MPLAMLPGLVLLVGHVVRLRVAPRSTGALGRVLVAALIIWLGLVVLSLILAIGLGWSIVQRKVSEQKVSEKADIDDVDGS